jgi:hypothetical protein
MGQAEQDCKDRTNRTGLPAQGCKDKTARQVPDSSPLSLTFCLFPSVSSPLSLPLRLSSVPLPLCLFNILNCSTYSRPLLPPSRAALGSKTGFPLWVGEKVRIRACFLSRTALSLFRNFFLRAFALFFSFALASAKKAPMPTSAYTTEFSSSTAVLFQVQGADPIADASFPSKFIINQIIYQTEHIS